MKAEEAPREYPLRPIPSVHTAIIRDNRVLLIQRGTEPNRGRWSLPGGGVELGEKLREAAQREVREECAVECSVESLIDVADNIVLDDEGEIRFHYVLVYFLSHYLAGAPAAGSDAADIAWVTREDSSKLDMSPVVREVLSKAFDSLEAVS